MPLFSHALPALPTTLPSTTLCTQLTHKAYLCKQELMKLVIQCSIQVHSSNHLWSSYILKGQFEKKKAGVKSGHLSKPGGRLGARQTPAISIAGVHTAVHSLCFFDYHPVTSLTPLCSRRPVACANEIGLLHSSDSLVINCIFSLCISTFFANGVGLKFNEST